MPDEEAFDTRSSHAVAYFNFVLTDSEEGAPNRDDDGHLYRFAREAEGQLYSEVQCPNADRFREVGVSVVVRLAVLD